MPRLSSDENLSLPTQGQRFSVGDFKEWTGVSRKYAFHYWNGWIGSASHAAMETHGSRCNEAIQLRFRPTTYNHFVAYSVTLIPGDGIGPEVADAAVRAVDATGVQIKWHRVELTTHIIQNSGQVFPNYVLDSLTRRVSA